MSEAPVKDGFARQRTDEHLIRVAERLFAQQGINAVSLRAIVAAAGHRNPSAVQYYFGSKEGLLEAILRYRLGPINRSRLAKLEAVGQPAGEGERRSVMEAFMVPLVELEPPGAYYCRFLSRTVSEGYLGPLFDQLPDEYGRSGRLIGEYMYRWTSNLPAALQQERVRMVSRLVLDSIAQRHEAVTSTATGQLDADAFVENLMDVALAILELPPSPTTMAAAKKSQKTAPRRRGKNLNAMELLLGHDRPS